MFGLSSVMIRALKELSTWGGDVSPDLEARVGCAKDALWTVIQSLQRRGLVKVETNGTVPLTAEGVLILAQIRAEQRCMRIMRRKHA